MPLSNTDELQQNLYGLAVDVVNNRAVFYLSAWRHGVQILECDPFGRTQSIEIVDLVDDQQNNRVFMLIADFAGKLHAHEITDVATTSGPHDQGRYGVFATWETEEPISDFQESNLYGLAVHKQVVGQQQRLIVYITGWKTGLRVLEFDPFDWVDGDTFCGPGCGDGEFFQDRGLIQTTGHASGLHFEPGNPDRLFLADTHGGLRIYKD